MSPSHQEKQLLERAAQIQVKAGKCDVLFKMLDSFNQNSIHVTVTWKLMHNVGSKALFFVKDGGSCINRNVFPGLYTIIVFYPSILFTLGSMTDYSDDAEAAPSGKISRRPAGISSSDHVFEHRVAQGQQASLQRSGADG